MNCTLYIVKCSDGSYYTGVTNDLDKRLRQHNGEIVGGAVYTRNKRPVKLVHKEEYGTHLEVSRREIEIKQMTRAEKEIIIEKWKKT
ncbi:MAG: GIY-YIG nuclease family protein [Patescibacteria group bacterium]|nr:GIY-YIG nuclease family protein [Patescibacteria group bacterium]